MHSNVSKYSLGSIQGTITHTIYSYHRRKENIFETNILCVWFIYVLCLVFADGLMVQFRKFSSYTADLRADFKRRKSWYDSVYKYMTTQHLDRSNKLNKRSLHALRSSIDLHFLNVLNCKNAKFVPHGTLPDKEVKTQQHKNCR